MGLFGGKPVCCICNQNTGSKKISSGMICDSCLAKAGYFITTFGLKNKSTEQVLEAIRANEQNFELANIYKSTKKIDKYLDVDENNRLWGAPCFSTHIYFRYDDIISFELLQNGNSVTKGGLGSAAVGGALFGGVGAIVGSNVGKKKTKQEVIEYRIKIITRNPIYPEVYINFLTAGRVMSDGLLYNSYAASAQRVLTELTLMTDERHAVSVNNTSSAADEIMKYKNLLDAEIITQEEFEAKKKQLLDL